MKKQVWASFFLAAGMVMGAAAGAAAQENTEELLPVSRVSVHDPSIIEDSDGTYYIFGSHIAAASSTDLVSWKQLSFDYSNPSNAFLYGNLQKALEKPFLWAGYDDADCTGGYAIWAPDIIWNPAYEWEDGSKGAYMLYVSTSSTWRRSAISYLVSKDIDGEYTFCDTIVYSGFTESGETDGNGSTRNTKWDNDYLNLKELVEKGSAKGGIDEVSDKWFTGNGGWDHTYGPNAIDPNVFFDASGDKMYMSYGSWSGGIYLLELDPATGEPYYPGGDGTDEISGNYVDRYFGTHLMGANHQSGEGPYISYDAQTGYYYLYVTYGGLQAEGGYNMRLFRSENPTGPYLDAAGNNAADNAAENNADDFGIKLMGNYAFYKQIGKRAAGHNSQLNASDGSRYLVYHQRFEIKPQLQAHEVRIHQQFMNEDLWPVTAVYEYRCEQPSHYENEEVTGSYEFINHGNATDGEMLPTVVVTLREDGTVTGSVQGTWEKADSGKGYDFATFEIDGVVYKGYFFKQHKENQEPDAVMTFSAIGENNECIWGSKVDENDPEMLTGIAAQAIRLMIPKAVNSDLELPTEICGCTVTWTSSDPSVVSEEGKVVVPDEKTKVTLTAQIEKDGTVLEEEYKMLVRK